MLPLSLLQAAANSPMLVELKSGDTYNGLLVNCDSWMNINLKEVVCTSSDGTKFWKLTECYIRGSSVKYLRLPDDIVDKVPEDDGTKHYGHAKGAGRGGRGGRGRGRGRGRGEGRGGRGGRGRSSGRNQGRGGGRRSN